MSNAWLTRPQPGPELHATERSILPLAPSWPRRGPNSGGFTLVELLVVLSIIALLAGLLFPVLIESRRRSYGTVCLSNLRQIGTASALYAQDWDGLQPFAVSPRTRADADAGGAVASPTLSVQLAVSLPLYMDLLTPFLGPNRGVFRCPADTGIWPSDGSVLSPTNCFEAWGSSYDYNDSWAVLGASPKNPSRVPLYMDESARWHSEAADSSPQFLQVLYADLSVRRVTGLQVAFDSVGALDNGGQGL